MVNLRQAHCDIDGCDKPHCAKGLCKMHYYRLRNTGTTDVAPQPERATCSVDGCPSVVKSRGYCNRHYQQVRNSGAVQPDDARDLSERFWARVDRSDPDGCWPWTGSTTKGYGNVRIEGAMHRVHRLAWVLTYGAIHESREIDHRCHDSSCRLGDHCPHRRCCNPAHLKSVTHIENMAAERSSLGSISGARQRAKLTCPRGHIYDEANTYTNSQGYRRCRACDREKQAARRAHV
jgi:hypothetical protein